MRALSCHQPQEGGWLLNEKTMTTKKIQQDEPDLTNIRFTMRLVMAQNEINAPKSRYNKFGNYNYRSAEDILNAAKPICMKYGMLLTVTDSVVDILSRPYVQAFATVVDCFGDGTSKVTTTALARIPNEKKGMDDSQVCGAASTYARKYALNGLFCIDDSTDDPDAGRTTDDKADSLTKVIAALSKCTSREEVNQIYISTADLHSDPKYMEAIQATCRKFPKQK